MRHILRVLMVVAGSMPLASLAPAATPPRVVATSKPLHALVAGVMAGVASPEVLVKGGASPHTYAMKPSDARALNQADLFFRVSESVEPFTAKVVQSLPRSVEVVTLQDAPGLDLLAIRTGTTFEPHAHAGGRKHRHEHEPAPKPGAVDGHIWLDPDNAKAMVDRMEQVLSARFPEHAGTFKANAESLKDKIGLLDADLGRMLEPVSGKPYIVSHDAFQYFERRYNLSVVGSISMSPEVPPSGKRLSDLRRKITSLGAACVFGEPQFDRRLVDNLIEGTGARTGMLDPEGNMLEAGPDLYFVLMRKLAENLRSCLLAPA
jgi:zinc transport system substrate-binding protein